jgi:hypothetical protein
MCPVFEMRECKSKVGTSPDNKGEIDAYAFEITE